MNPKISSDFLKAIAIPETVQSSPGKIGNSKIGSAVERAIAWRLGEINHVSNTLINRNLQLMYESSGFQVALGKPGKEYFLDKRQNVHDMKPTLVLDGSEYDYSPTFTQIFDDFQQIANSTSESAEFALVTIACLLFKAAYLLEHEYSNESLDQNGVPLFKWTPSKVVLSTLLNEWPTITAGRKVDSVEIPTDVYLYLLDCLAYNEDVKYQGAFKAKTKNTGRRNNLLTVVHVIAVVLGRASIAELIGKATQQRGVSPIQNRKAYEVFPWLVGGVDPKVF